MSRLYPGTQKQTTKQNLLSNVLRTFVESPYISVRIHGKPFCSGTTHTEGMRSSPAQRVSEELLVVTDVLQDLRHKLQLSTTSETTMTLLKGCTITLSGRISCPQKGVTPNLFHFNGFTRYL